MAGRVARQSCSFGVVQIFLIFFIFAESHMEIECPVKKWSSLGRGSGGQCLSGSWVGCCRCPSAHVGSGLIKGEPWVGGWGLEAASEQRDYTPPHLLEGYASKDGLSKETPALGHQIDHHGPGKFVGLESAKA